MQKNVSKMRHLQLLPENQHYNQEQLRLLCNWFCHLRRIHSNTAQQLEHRATRKGFLFWCGKRYPSCKEQEGHDKSCQCEILKEFEKFD